MDTDSYGNLFHLDTNDIMNKLIKIEEISEDILTKKQEIVELQYKKDKNKDALSAFKLQQIQFSTNIYMNYGDSLVKLPRKDIFVMIEGDQVKIDQEIKVKNKEIEEKTIQLSQLKASINSS